MIDQTPSVQSVELLPCPFCGTTAHVVAFPRQHEGRMAAKIECFTDFCYAVVWADTPSQAITAWNRRAAPAPSSLAGGARERIKTILDEETTVGGTSASRSGAVNSDELAGLILAALSPEAPARDAPVYHAVSLETRGPVEDARRYREHEERFGKQPALTPAMKPQPRKGTRRE